MIIFPGLGYLIIKQTSFLFKLVCYFQILVRLIQNQIGFGNLFKE
jgi:hypothetical protein